jgi:2-polyprenyl-3-methyl-5-hydroxy-6-metoxy-1,4-benzoquinol methylase
VAEGVTHCPLCSGTESLLFDQRDFRGRPVTNRICTVCGLVFQSPHPSAAELESFYEREYRLLYQGESGPTAKDLAVQEKRAAVLLQFIQRSTGDGFTSTGPTKTLRHLDIGCSSGLLLERFQAAAGTRPVGVEPGTAYREHARRRGLTVYASLHELQEAGERRFDLVSLLHVLEHLPDPAGTLVELREKFLATGGLLLLEVPNLYAHDCFEVAHLVSFSSHTLLQVVERAGYEGIALRRHGLPRSRLLPLYITLLARPALALPEPSSGRLHRTIHLRPERGVGLKRKAGMFRRRVLQKIFPHQAWIEA